MIGTKNPALCVEHLVHHFFRFSWLTGFRKRGSEVVHRVDRPRVIGPKDFHIHRDRTAKKIFCFRIAAQACVRLRQSDAVDCRIWTFRTKKRSCGIQRLAAKHLGFRVTGLPGKAHPKALAWP